MSRRIGPITLDGDTADAITLLNLKEARAYLKKELAEWKKNPKTESNPGGVWMHPDDVVENQHLIQSFNVLIKYYGG